MTFLKYLFCLVAIIIGIPLVSLGIFLFLPATEATARPYFALACMGIKQLGHHTEAANRGGHIEQVDCACLAKEIPARMGSEQFTRAVEKARIRSSDYLTWQLRGRQGQPRTSIPLPDRDLDQVMEVGLELIQSGQCYGPGKG